MKPTVTFVIASLFCFGVPAWVFTQSAAGSGAKSEVPLSLVKLVEEATERNPEVLAARRNVDAKRARIPQAGAWADPTVTLSYGGNAVPPFTVMVFGASVGMVVARVLATLVTSN